MAVLAGLVGFFVVLRGVSFAAHALAQMGFAGAAGAVLLGLDPLWGLVVFAVGGALGLGAARRAEHERDATTALVLVAALGTGALFLALNSTFATAAFSLLFGSIVGISRAQVWADGACWRWADARPGHPLSAAAVRLGRARRARRRAVCPCGCSACCSWSWWAWPRR